MRSIIAKCVSGARKGLIGKSGLVILVTKAGTAPATVTGERGAIMPLKALAFEKAATSATIREVRKPA